MKASNHPFPPSHFLTSFIWRFVHACTFYFTTQRDLTQVYHLCVVVRWSDDDLLKHMCHMACSRVNNSPGRGFHSLIAGDARALGHCGLILWSAVSKEENVTACQAPNSLTRRGKMIQNNYWNPNLSPWHKIHQEEMIWVLQVYNPHRPGGEVKNPAATNALLAQDLYYLGTSSNL